MNTDETRKDQATEITEINPSVISVPSVAKRIEEHARNA